MATDRQRPTWPPAAQVAAALILTTCLATLGWTAYEHRDASAGALTSNDYIVDLNGADHAELLQLPGVGESLAGRIEAYRDKHGPFQAVEDLRNVRGIGPKTLARLSPYVGVSKSSGAGSSQAQASNTEGGNTSTKTQRAKDDEAVEGQGQGDRP
jgi:competence protein ComEA